MHPSHTATTAWYICVMIIYQSLAKIRDVTLPMVASKVGLKGSCILLLYYFIIAKASGGHVGGSAWVGVIRPDLNCERVPELVESMKRPKRETCSSMVNVPQEKIHALLHLAPFLAKRQPMMRRSLS